MSSYPHTDDPLVRALQLLLAREGGHIKVSDETGVSDQSLYQIANCKPDAKTGKPKSVGPSIRKRLSERYGDWLSSTAPPGPPEITLEAALEVLGMALAREMPADVREDVADALAKLARRKGQMRDQQQVQSLLTDTSSGKERALA